MRLGSRNRLDALTLSQGGSEPPQTREGPGKGDQKPIKTPQKTLPPATPPRPRRATAHCACATLPASLPTHPAPPVRRFLPGAVAATRPFPPGGPSPVALPPAQEAAPPAQPQRPLPAATPEPPSRHDTRAGLWEGGRHHSFSGGTPIRPLRSGGTARPRPPPPPQPGPRGAARGAALPAGEREQLSAGKELLVRHEAAQSGAVAAAGWGVLRDVHGRGDQVRLHVCASRDVRVLLGTTSPSVPCGRAPQSCGGLWRAACWDM